MMIMGESKDSEILSRDILKWYFREFATRLAQSETRLMVIGYSFQDEHINEVIERASSQHGLGTYLVNPTGRAVLRDPKLERASIYVPRSVEDINLIGEMRRPLSTIFGGRDSFAHGELMRFFF